MISQNDNYLPENRRDKVLFLFMALAIPALTLWEWLIVLPAYHGWTLSNTVVLHLALSTFIVINLACNVYYIVRVGAAGKTSLLPIVLKPGWRHCYDCGLNYPPRSYHCYICKKCTLKRDHHCGFTGCCIGYHNHRYYLMAASFLWIGALYGTIFQWNYCLTKMGGLSFGAFLALTAPHFALMFGYLSLAGFVVAVVHIMWLVLCAVSSYMVFTQVIAIYRGQTQYERRHDIRTYDLGWKRNLKDVLGSKWYITWIFPTLSSPLLGDGLKFTPAIEYEDVKNI